MREEVMSNYIAGSVNIFDGGLQLIVDLNPTFSDLDTNFLKPQPFDIWFPSRRNQDPINDDFTLVARIRCLELDAILL